MYKKAISIIALSILTNGCANVSSSSADYVSAEEQTNGKILLSRENLPDDVNYKVIGTVKANARQGYDSVESLYPLLIEEARKVGANAVINVYGGRTVSAFSWAAPFTGGTAVKIENMEEVENLHGVYF